ncbi:hypothetical protein AArcSl_2563 [Halalkaliarchaeum desulfuricum]|uniref:DUF7322 domain-containing protein n=1 Tax=Halalkaliarchaeum desulfuricum TaxID=2055893 RepID=A0A343TM61_9EURY|nr:hypothetical protein [Halalkaliarchaeum desulfuricum]AUX10183.1 hypothetical protein AArcSl_2563 [Halalkaliarchaeum desulfuricum]
MTEPGGTEEAADEPDESPERFDLEETVSIEPSSVEIPEAPTVRTFGKNATDEQLQGAIEGVHPDLLRLFVASVVALNLALLAFSLGVMVWYFEGMSRIGGALVFVGAVAGFRTYQYYREYDTRDWNEEDPTDNEVTNS